MSLRYKGYAKRAKNDIVYYIAFCSKEILKSDGISPCTRLRQFRDHLSGADSQSVVKQFSLDLGEIDKSLHIIQTDGKNGRKTSYAGCALTPNNIQ